MSPVDPERRKSSLVFHEAVTAGLGTPGLRRLQAAWGTAALGSWMFFVALAIYAYDQGGATAVGTAALVRMIPAGLAAPAAGVLVDRMPRRDVLLWTLTLRAVLAAAIAAAVAAEAGLGAVLALAALFTVAMTAHRPGQAALLPTVADTPRQLAAANALWTALDNAAFLGGSLLCGVLIATTSVETAFAAIAALYAVSVLPTAAVQRDPVPGYRAAAAQPHPLAQLAAGTREVRANRDLSLLVGVVSAARLVEGAVDVLVVVIALDLLDLGDAGVGWLNAAWGFGGIAGGAAAIALLRRGRLSAGLALGGLLVGGSFVVIAAVIAPAVAVAMLVVLGVGYALIDAASLSLLQRLTSDEVLGRAFAVVETSYWLMTGLGAILAPLLVALLGERGAVLAVGASLPVLVLLRRAPLSRFEKQAVVPEREFGLLRSLSLFAPLPLASIENLARRVSERQVSAGEVVIAEGEPGEEFFVVAGGVLDVDTGTEGAHPRLRTGDFFGEIALLRDIPRTATVTAREDTLLYVLDREAFLWGIGAHPRCTEAAEHVTDRRMRAV